MFRRAVNSIAISLVFVTMALGARAAERATVKSPLTPEEALKAFVVEPGVEVELVAAEPLVESPVAMAFDERGRMFVAENRGYPTGPKPGEPPQGRIALLEDTEGDGRMDRRTTFADGLTFPNGVLPWDGGVIVTCAPDILFLKDTNGDGVADERKVLFTGFSTARSTQLRVSHPTLAIDGWIYVTGGLSGGKVTCPAHPERPPVEFSRADFRFRPDLSAYEQCDGGGQFGLSFDDFGRRFTCYNRVQVQHVVLSSRDLKRNPNLAFAETLQNCPAELAPEPLKGHGQAARVYPLSNNITTADSHAGTFTAACGLIIFRGDGLPAKFRGGAFSCEPTGNLVHFDRLEPNGVTFSARRDRPNAEFLATADSWFRPVFLAHGPDGGLYVCDMYRQTIEHPDYLPEEIRKRTNFEGGKGMGRIWRLAGSDSGAPDLVERRRGCGPSPTDEQLLESLTHTNSWHRDTAFRLLLARSKATTVRECTKILHDGALPATTRMLALQLLNEWKKLEASTLLALIETGPPELCEQAIGLAVPLWANRPELVAATIERADTDSTPRVGLVAALALANTNDTKATETLAYWFGKQIGDRWMRAAVLSSIQGRGPAFLALVAARLSHLRPNESAALIEAARTVAAGQSPDECVNLIRYAFRGGKVGGRREILIGVSQSLRGRVSAANAKSPLLEILKTTSKDPDIGADLKEFLERARESARDTTFSGLRRPAVELLGETDFEFAGETLLPLVDKKEPAELQTAAVRALGGMTNPQIAAALLERQKFLAYSPALREEVLSALLANPKHLPGVLAAVERGDVPVGAIDTLRRQRFLNHTDADIKTRAAKVFVAPGNRQKVYDELKGVVQLPTDPSAGRAVFAKVCANCHRLDQVGVGVGPDLFSIRNQAKEAILMHLIIPEYEITPGFITYTLETQDGRVLTGLLVAETESSVTLRQSLGKEDTVLRSQIERLVASQLSLMPQELEKQMTRQDLANLLAYLKGEGGSVKGEE